MSEFAVEICVESVESVLNAYVGGAKRVEVCANLLEGGTTPSYGLLKRLVALRETHPIAINVLVRPRGGDFLYSEEEMEVIEADVRACRDLGIDGVVIGFLKSDGTIDVEKTRRIIEAARPMSLTFHRAIDVCSNWRACLDHLIALKVDRVLTSGGVPAEPPHAIPQMPTAEKGMATIREMVERSGGRISIMPGGGIDESNLRRVVEFTGVREIHGSARSPVESKMEYRRLDINMGGVRKDEAGVEFSRKISTINRVRAFVNEAAAAAAASRVP